MGVYVLNIEEHPPFGKVQTLLALGGRLISKPVTVSVYRELEEIPICVVANRAFEAALVVADDADLERTHDPKDSRPQTWIALPKAVVVSELGIQERYL